MSAQASSAPQNPMSRRLSGLLDCLRWLSAVIVVITHTANLMVARWADTPHELRSSIQLVWTFLGGFGHQSVMTFYVLSGFLVGGPLIVKARSHGSIPWLKYSIDRLVRIYLVLIPALVACFLLDRIAFRFAPEIMGEFIHGHTSWPIFFGNLANLQNFFVPFFGSDGPIGTLAIEMWFYISFPLFLAPWCTHYSRVRQLIFVTLAVAITVMLTFAQPGYLAGFAIWLIGVHARLSVHPQFRRLLPPMLLLGLTLMAIRAVMSRDMSSNSWMGIVADLALAASLHLLLVTARYIPDSPHGFFPAGIHKRLAGFSYSLYAIHMPLLFLLTIVSKRWFGFGIVDLVVHGWEWLLVASVILVTLIFSYLFSLLTEGYTAPLRRLIFTRLGQRDWGLNTITRR